MSTQTTVWVMITTDGVSEKISDLIDSGYFAEAQDLDWQLKSVVQKLQSLIGERGGQIHLSTYSRQVIELPVTLAQELPLILAGYRKVFGMLMAVGMGLDLREASLAAKKSVFSNDIELYDPKDEAYEHIKKNLQIEDDAFNFQPNLYDETHPPSPKADSSKDSVVKFVPGLNAQQSLEAENQLIQATVQQLMGPAQDMQQQMQQQQEQQAQQEQKEGGGPDSLLEALSGEKKSDKPKTSSKEKDSDKDEDDDSDDKSSKKDSESDSDSSSDDDSDEDDSDESDDTTEKLGTLLQDVENKLPKLMEMHDKNPEAFKKVVTLIHKLVAVAKARKGDESKKAETMDMTEELNKALHLHYPVGTVKKRKKKVIIDGKAKWRSVASGQVKDEKGNAISVQSHNAKAGEQGAV